MNGFAQQFATTLRLHFRNRIALLYGYLFPIIFLVVFRVLYRHEDVPLLLHFGELLTVTILGGACFGLPTTLVSERERGVWRRYHLAPLPIGRLLLSTLLARFVLVASAGLLQLALAVGVGMTPPVHPLSLAVAFTAAAFAFIALGLVIAALADSVPAVQALGQCLFLPLLILGGVAVPIASLPGWAQQLAAYLPGGYAVDALQRAMHGAIEPAVSFDLLALGMIGAAATLTGVKLFRWEPGQHFRSLAGKAWLVPVLAGWLVIGALAHVHGHRATRGAAANASAVTRQSPAEVSLAPWERLTTAEIDTIRLVAPPDNGRVTPMARPDETPDDETDLTLAKLEGELPHWAPGRVADPVQRVRNLLAVAGVIDVLQNPAERYVPRLIQRRLETEFPREKLAQLLAWIALHPADGTTVTDLAGLNLPGAVSEAVVRERVQLYSIKLLARVTGRSTVAR